MVLEKKIGSSNAKDPPGDVPVDLQGVTPGAYAAPIDSTLGSAQRKNQGGTEGFNPQLAGRGKAGEHDTTSFSMGPPDYTLPGYPSGNETAVGQEEGGRPRQATTSSAGRKIKQRNKDKTSN